MTNNNDDNNNNNNNNNNDYTLLLVIFRGWTAQILLHLLSVKKKVSDKRKGQETIDKRVDVIIKESRSATNRS